MVDFLQQYIRKGLVLFRGKRNYSYTSLPQMCKADATQQIIFNLLVAEKPCMIARFGSVELQAIVDSLYKPTLRSAIRFVKGEIPSWGYAPSTRKTMRINAGFFPISDVMLDRFSELMRECMTNVDVLGSWRPEENEVINMMPQCIRVPLHGLEPYYFEKTWMPALEGEKVLVIHPFEDTIRKQHARLYNLFANPEMAPHYELKTIKAVQSIAGNKPEGFETWFEALDWMKGEIDKTDFDIAIIGCGAYGFPLASYVKQIGKKAIHLGGATQYLFGIVSNAAEQNLQLKSLINSSWVRPTKEETPSGIEKVENSRYW